MAGGWQPGPKTILTLVAWPAAERPEPSLAEKPLEFLLEDAARPSSSGEHSTDPGAWKPLVWDESRRCFAFHLQGAFEPSLRAHFFGRIRDTAPWQSLQDDKTRTKISRHTAWYTRSSSCNCAYTYGEDTRVEAPAQKDTEFRKVMESLTACVFSKFPGMPEEAWPNCANVNYYSDGDQGVGWHADDELIFMGTARDCPILSLSLGGMREFWIALKSDCGVDVESTAPDVRKGIAECDVRDGDFVTMEGFMQKHTMHCVPRACPSDARRNDPRINVTFRWMRVHKQECPYAKVAQTWLMLAGSSSAEAESALTEGNDKDDDKKHTRGMIKILDPVTQKPIENTGLRVSKKERVAIMSPLPQSARALFGEGERKLSGGALPHACPSEAFLLDWNAGGAASGQAGTEAAGKAGAASVKWQPCDFCGHVCWGGGRPCKSGGRGNSWYCRCCWTRWAEDEAAAAVYQEASAPPEYPGQYPHGADPGQYPGQFCGAWMPPPYGCSPLAPFVDQAALLTDPRYAALYTASAGFPCQTPATLFASPWMHQT
ncbi:unnamed protein product [Prorocentrum cordatum]|uniref:Fe2OG dioxygenase domain-containing protein n=1 Tax=Prorocentrum cordatum TaxID=2364126 RepID=A0ABN9PF50_9DINO|nr:unnamed protein product [Polarella glacialis]